MTTKAKGDMKTYRLWLAHMYDRVLRPTARTFRGKDLISAERRAAAFIDSCRLTAMFWELRLEEDTDDHES